MDWFIHSRNLQHYRKLLEETKDEERRRMILALLAEEESKEQNLPANGHDMISAENGRRQVG